MVQELYFQTFLHQSSPGSRIFMVSSCLLIFTSFTKLKVEKNIKYWKIPIYHKGAISNIVFLCKIKSKEQKPGFAEPRRRYVLAAYLLVFSFVVYLQSGSLMINTHTDLAAELQAAPVRASSRLGSWALPAAVRFGWYTLSLFSTATSCCWLRVLRRGFYIFLIS